MNFGIFPFFIRFIQHHTCKEIAHSTKCQLFNSYVELHFILKFKYLMMFVSMSIFDRKHGKEIQ